MVGIDIRSGGYGIVMVKNFTIVHHHMILQGMIETLLERPQGSNSELKDVGNSRYEEWREKLNHAKQGRIQEREFGLVWGRCDVRADFRKQPQRGFSRLEREELKTLKTEDRS